MLRRFWRRIQQFFRRLLGIGRTTSPPRGSEENSLPPVKAKTSKPQRTDLEYEVIFSELLEGVNQGWSRGNVLGFLIAKSIDDAELIAWLHRFEENLQATPEQHQELARRMVLLGEVYGKELGKVAGEIGKRLLAQVPQLDDVASGEVIEADDTTDDAEGWFEQGNQQYYRGDFQGAIASYDKALAIQPDKHEAWNNRGIALGNLGRFEEEIASYDKALAIQPDKHEAWYNRGIALGNLGRFEEEIASYDKALAIQPDYHQAWYNRGNALGNLGRIEEAIASYDKALAIKPDKHEAWNNRGNALGNLGRFEEVIASYDKALAIKPDKHEAWNNRGIALGNLGRIEEAIASYDKALAIQPDYHQAWYNRGNALGNLGRIEEAIASYDKALAIQPDYHQAWYNRGNALGNLGRIEEAIASYDKALAIQPDYHQAWYNRGNALGNLGRIEEAIASYDKALAIQSDKHEAWYNRGYALGNLGRIEEEIASYDKALAIKPDLHEAWNNRGNALGNLGRIEEAIASYDKALAIQPDYHEAWINRGIAARSSRHYYSQAATILQMQFPLSPVVLPNPTLNQRGYQGELLCYQEGLKHCPQETHPQGWGKLNHAIGKAHYFQRKNSEAVTSYNQALKTLTSDAFPELHLEVLQDLIKALLSLRRTPEAEQLKRDGTDLLRRLLAESKSQRQKEQLALKFASFQQLTVDIAIQSGQIIPALETAEAGKNACLSWLLYAYSDEIASPNYAEIQQLLQPTTAIVYWHLSPAALTTFILKHGETPKTLETRFLGETGFLEQRPETLETRFLEETGFLEQRPETLETRFLEETGFLEQRPETLETRFLEETGFLEQRPETLETRFLGETGFLEQHPETLETRFLGETGFLEQRLEKFEKWVKDWNQQYTEYGKGKKSETEQTSNWRDNLPEKLKQLKEILDIPKIETTLTGITHLILIPHRDLHRFPLHSLFADKFTITYLPSAKIGLMTQGKNPEKQGKLFSVEDPNSEKEKSDEPLQSLPFAKVESEYICRLFPNNNQRLPSEQATQTAVETELSKGYAIFHFTGHGSYNFHAPKKSALCLTKKQRLRMEDIVKLSFANSQLVCLSACETAITGNQTITSEYVGLVSAFLSRGVSQVVSTLWTVQSDASALVMMQFYHLRQHKSNVEALNQATRWLRDATATELAQWYQEILQELEPDEPIIRPFIRTQLVNVKKKEPSEKPYNHPYHWAGFIITGM
ncbi:MAG: tetratricopeptide repeat protein [Phormidium sp.]